MKPCRMFAVQLDLADRSMSVTAGSDGTRAWCEANGVEAVLDVAVGPFLDRKVSPDPKPGQRPSGNVTPTLVAGVVERRLLEAFPDERILVAPRLEHEVRDQYETERPCQGCGMRTGLDGWCGVCLSKPTGRNRDSGP